VADSGNTTVSLPSSLVWQNKRTTVIQHDRVTNTPSSQAGKLAFKRSHLNTGKHSSLFNHRQHRPLRLQNDTYCRSPLMLHTK
jgi:hypothetical protein